MQPNEPGSHCVVYENPRGFVFVLDVAVVKETHKSLTGVGNFRGSGVGF